MMAHSVSSSIGSTRSTRTLRPSVISSPASILVGVEACVGDWIVYYEPRKVRDTRGYFAIAQVAGVREDPRFLAKLYFADIVAGSFLEFANPVPFSGPSGLIEHGVLNEDGRISGRAQAAVRSLSRDDFERIYALGTFLDGVDLPRRDEDAVPTGFEDEQVPFTFGNETVRDRHLVSRTIRDPIFRKIVLRAYGERCGVSGLKLINGGGRAEVEAAHIRPVEKGGPDIASNGVALCGTAHWMFDRGMISFSDDLDIMVSRHVNDIDGVRAMINSTGRLLAPGRASDRPHPHFLGWHRDHCFKA